MFERYTEGARRVLFCARYTASELGSIAIEADHLLLGLLREPKGLVETIFQKANVSVRAVENEVRERNRKRAQVHPSVEIPFTEETKKVLQFSAEEADRLNHGYIGSEHLLLGLLREGSSPAAALLLSRGITLEGTRKQIAELLEQAEASIGWSTGHSVDRIKQLVLQLSGTRPGSAEQRGLLDRILDSLEGLKRRLNE